MDPIAGLLDGPRARRAFLLRCTLDPPWALHIRDEAPLSLVAMLRGRACFVLDGREPEWLDRGDVAILLGPDHYLFADDPATPPQAIIHPDQRCTTPDGQEIPQMRSFGMRRWGNAPDGATEILTAVHFAISFGDFGSPVPIMESRVTSSASLPSLQSSVPAGRIGTTR